jgi:phage tail tape-measure protein
MRNRILIAGAALAALAMPLAAQAQNNGGAAAGATTGAIGGAIVGGPVGAVVGGIGGAIVGGIAGENQARFNQYVVRQDVPSYRYQEEVRVGAVLPSDGVRYYEVPQEYGVTNYRYTVVNETPVLVDPSTRRVVQVIR